mmetsp:Transcript_14872/g.41093  ORF Transcript_14872/g.41093 Transcript_14872/m.41093 type:complete len:289 (+) Transcript_14872:1681-2547(+)
MGHDITGGRPHILTLVKELLDEVLARWMHTPWDSHDFAPDFMLVPKGEATSHQAISEDTHGPHVDLCPVVLVVDLRGPKQLRADQLAETLVGAHADGRAEVRERDVAHRIGQVPAVHDVVVTLDVAMDDAPAVHVLDAGTDLLHEVDDVLAAHVPPLLQLPLQALDEIAAIKLVHHDTDEAPLMENVVAPHDVRMVHVLQYCCLSLDVFHGSLHLVDHLHSKLFTSCMLPADRNHAKGTFAQCAANNVFLQEPWHWAFKLLLLIPGLHSYTPSVTLLDERLHSVHICT